MSCRANPTTPPLFTFSHTKPNKKFYTCQMKQENFYLFYQADKDSFFAVPDNADGNHLTQAPEDKKKPS
jgi:hypothetical protein